MGGFPRGVSSKPTGESTSPLWVGDLPKFCTIIERSIVSPSWHFLGSFHKGLRSIVSLVTIYFPSFVLAWRVVIGIVYVLKATRNLFYLTNNWIIMNHLTHRVNIYIYFNPWTMHWCVQSLDCKHQGAQRSAEYAA